MENGAIKTAGNVSAQMQVCDKNGKNRDGALYNMKFNNVYAKNLAESTTNEDLKNIFTEN
ncbi:hypothetical protein SADUNF_Sadunf01G0115100 [Salix dunnii]|uniref:Uncharacterized protein n=1 Tax=Salix dunnii TaxID=1413687 RepID=A0A835TN63_9ROSI|nr:hypothetical protein SADUNF_Sadunf01G0115100 [Salix dunnii]